MSVFIDTGVFVAYINKRDSNHEKAVYLLEDIMKGKYGKAYTSDYIFDEATTFSLMKTKDVRKALDVGRLILGDEELPRFVDILFVDRVVFNRAWEIFLKYGRLSFTDCTSVVVMDEYEIGHIASFDSGFDGVVERLY